MLDYRELYRTIKTLGSDTCLVIVVCSLYQQLSQLHFYKALRYEIAIRMRIIEIALFRSLISIAKRY